VKAEILGFVAGVQGAAHAVVAVRRGSRQASLRRGAGLGPVAPQAVIADPCLGAAASSILTRVPGCAGVAVVARLPVRAGALPEDEDGKGALLELHLPVPVRRVRDGLGGLVLGAVQPEHGQRLARFHVEIDLECHRPFEAQAVGQRHDVPLPGSRLGRQGRPIVPRPGVLGHDDLDLLRALNRARRDDDLARSDGDHAPLFRDRLPALLAGRQQVASLLEAVHAGGLRDRDRTREVRVFLRAGGRREQEKEREEPAEPRARLFGLQHGAVSRGSRRFGAGERALACYNEIGTKDRYLKKGGDARGPRGRRVGPGTETAAGLGPAGRRSEGWKPRKTQDRRKP